MWLRPASECGHAKARACSLRRFIARTGLRRGYVLTPAGSGIVVIRFELDATRRLAR